MIQHEQVCQCILENYLSGVSMLSHSLSVQLDRQAALRIHQGVWPEVGRIADGSCKGMLKHLTARLMFTLSLQASGVAGKASVAMMGWDVTHSGKKGQMSIAEATE